MFAERFGSGRDVVVLHGAPQSPDHLRDLAVEVAATGVRAHLVHLPGYGRSPAPPLPYDLERVGTELAGELLRADIRQPILVGFSGGSLRAFSLACSGAIDAAAIVDLGPLAHLATEHRAGLRALAAELRAGGSIHAAARDSLFSPGFRARDEAHADAITAETLASVAPAVLASELDAFAAHEGLRPALRELRCPVVLRVGAEDAATPPDYARAIAAAAPRCTLDVVEGAGHALWVEDPAGCITAVRAALAAV